jgi:virginiamycin B lyase
MDTSGRLLGEFPIPTAGSKPRGITAGPCGDNHLYFTEQIGRIARIDTSGNITVLANTGIGSNLGGITRGPAGDCNLYVADRGQDCIVRMEMTGQFIVMFLAIGSNPSGIVSGPDGNLWFTETGLNRIGRMSTSGGLPAESPVPSPSTFPEGIAIGPDANIWFTETAGNRIGRVLTGVTPALTPTPTPFPGITVVPRRGTPATKPFRTP